MTSPFSRFIRLLVVLFCGFLVDARINTGLERVTPSGVKMPLVPSDGQLKFTAVEAFPGLTFDNPVGVVSAPGDNNRLFVIERKGRIMVIPNLSSPSKEVFLDISGQVHSEYADPQSDGAEGICSIAFHPNWRNNRRFFITYSIQQNGIAANRLSRFEIDPSNPNRALPHSEFPMITQPDEGYGHNFNELRFGPDGYLYLAAGDEGDGQAGGDEYKNSQRIDKDFFSAILRIDVDEKSGNLPPTRHPAVHGGYRVPRDNPFVGATTFNGQAVTAGKVREEFYAVGFRNPWRISFDPATGRLYTGDVGLRTREEINVVTKGGNYGWGFREGTATGPLGNPPAGVSLIPPIIEYSRDDGGCVIGGFVYRGSRFPELQGRYIFGDWSSGKIWATTYDGSSASPKQEISGLYSLSAFGEDPRNGDVLICWDNLERMQEEKIYRLERQSGSGGAPIPPTLADTGLFSDLASLVPVPGFVPYDVNVPLWSDYAEKRRWFGILGSEPKIQFSREGNWTFPSGTVWIKHFEIEMVEGVPSTTKRLETRVLVKNDSGVYGVTYRWDNNGSNAALVPAEGMSETLEIETPTSTRIQEWRYPSRSDCLTCHTPSAGYALGFNTPQLNRTHPYPNREANQILALAEAGYLDGWGGSLNTLRKLAPLDDEAWSREARVRSYLFANCVFCHNPNGIDRSQWDARIHLPISQTGIINGSLADSFGDSDNRVVKPGDPTHSVLLKRMNELSQARMPPLGTSVVHEEAVQLISDWIAQDLADYKTFDQWIAAYAVGALDGGNDDADGDGAENWLEYLQKSNPTNPGDAFNIGIGETGGQGRITFSRQANVGYEVQHSNSLTGSSWSPLDVPDNAPFFSAENGPHTVDFLFPPAQNGFYRVRVYEP